MIVKGIENKQMTVGDLLDEMELLEERIEKNKQDKEEHEAMNGVKGRLDDKASKHILKIKEIEDSVIDEYSKEGVAQNK